MIKGSLIAQGKELWTLLENANMKIAPRFWKAYNTTTAQEATSRKIAAEVQVK